MDTLYWIAFLVGGFFVALSLFGGDHFGGDADHDLGGHDFDHSSGAGSGLVDLFSIRALFLFAAFFGLTGLAFTWLDAGEPFTALVAALTGLVVGLGGNYAIKRIGYQQVSSSVTSEDLQGLTAKVILPFKSGERGKITVVSKGYRLQLTARPFEDAEETFAPGDEVVIVQMSGRIAEVVRPGGELPAAPPKLLDGLL